MKNTWKKIIAFITAVGMLLSLAGCKSNDSKKDEGESTSISAEDEELGLILTEDFDINDSDAVKKRAQAIYDISEKKVSVDQIVNIIYYFNDKLDSLSLGKTDKEKVNGLKTISSDAYALLYNNIEDDSLALSNILSGKEQSIVDDEEIFAYHLMASGDEKKTALENARIVKEQLNNIRDKNKEGLSLTAEKFYTNVLSIKNNKDIKASSQTLILMCSKSKLGIMSGSFLSKEKSDELNKISYSNTLNLVYSDAIKKLGLSSALDEMIDEKRNDGTLGKPLTKEEEKYKKEDAKEAQTHPAIKEEKTTTVKVDNGGTKVEDNKGKQEVVKPKEEVTTTVTEEETFVAPVPDDVVTEEEITGGEVVSEEEVSNSYYITAPVDPTNTSNEEKQVYGKVRYVDNEPVVTIYDKPYTISK